MHTGLINELCRSYWPMRIHFLYRMQGIFGRRDSATITDVSCDIGDIGDIGKELD